MNIWGRENMIVIDIKMSSNTHNKGITKIHILDRSPSPVTDKVDNEALFSRSRTGSFHHNMTRCDDSLNTITYKTTLIKIYIPYGAITCYLPDHDVELFLRAIFFTEPTLERKYNEKVENKNRTEICVAQ